jgi:N utilization substance protein A
MKGSRVQAIIRELRGERIDIIEWSEDPAVFAANALSPAKVAKVEINSFEEKKLTVTVPEDQLSLAIGKKGQNVRLAAKLVGWHIDIRSAEEAARAAAAQLEAVMAGGEATLTDIRESLALDQITAERLKDRGIETIEQLATVTVDELVDAIDVSFDQANEILDRAHRLLAQKHAREVKEARDAEEAALSTAAEATAEVGEAQAPAEAGTEAPAEAGEAEAHAEIGDTEARADAPAEELTAEGAETEVTEGARAAVEAPTEEAALDEAVEVPAEEAAETAEETAAEEMREPESSIEAEPAAASATIEAEDEQPIAATEEGSTEGASTDVVNEASETQPGESAGGSETERRHAADDDKEEKL